MTRPWAGKTAPTNVSFFIVGKDPSAQTQERFEDIVSGLRMYKIEASLVKQDPRYTGPATREHTWIMEPDFVFFGSIQNFAKFLKTGADADLVMATPPYQTCKDGIYRTDTGITQRLWNFAIQEPDTPLPTLCARIPWCTASPLPKHLLCKKYAEGPQNCPYLVNMFCRCLSP
jgi:hypothetical protein